VLIQPQILMWEIIKLL